MVSGIMEHLREKLKSSPQFKTNLATLGISNRPKHALMFHQYILFLKHLLSISEPKT